MGHYIEAGVAYWQATGNTKALRIACRMAESIDDNFGPEAGKIHGSDGHPEIELALAKLYEVTGEKRYLELAEYLVKVRGQDPSFYDRQNALIDDDNHIFPEMRNIGLRYYQAAEPVTEQRDANGHAVRMAYLCAGLAHIARLAKDDELLRSARRLWRSIVSRRMYITGGIGSTHVGESFTCDYDLPNDTMYGETCASIAMVFFARRMLENEARGEYADVIERELFNGALSGISLDGKKYFYVNPLEALPESGKGNPDRTHVLCQRVDWFGCACCPANIARLLASIDHYVYTELDAGSTVLSHQFIANEAQFHSGLRVRQESDFPWDGHVQYEVTLPRKADDMERPLEVQTVRFGVRIPWWSARRYELRIDGGLSELPLEDGFVYVNIRPGQAMTIELELDMSVKAMTAASQVHADVGKIAIMRGPLVYCAEQVDNDGDLWSYTVPDAANLKAYERHDERLLGGITMISVPALRRSEQDAEERETDDFSALYRQVTSSDLRDHGEHAVLTLVPYYTWANRVPGAMRVWLDSNV